MKKINILGSTGIIGKNTLKIIDRNFDNYIINFLLANNNYKLLAQQANKFKPNYIGLLNSKNYYNLKKLLKNKNIKIVTGNDCIEILKKNVSSTILAISGISALELIEQSIKNSKKVGIVNKEALVSAGKFIIKLAKKNNTKIFPLDSEHYSIYNYLLYSNLNNFKNIKKIYLTASGGPFLYKKINSLKNVTLKQALKHPTWKMGLKNTIDSSTMINKCLEIIEAHYLFNLQYDKLDIIIHPESLIHSIINTKDGSLNLNMSNNDMSIPLFSFLNNNINNPYNNLDIKEINKLRFLKPNKKQFPSLRIFDQLNKNSLSDLIIFNTSNEYAVNLFIKNKIKYNEITNYIEKSLNKFEKINIYNIKDVILYQKYLYDKLHKQGI